MKVLKWIGDHIWIVVIALVAALAWFVGRRGLPPSVVVKKELKALDAEKKADILVVKHGAEKAREVIKAEHKETLEKIDEKQKKKAEKLAVDPAALAKFLVRVGSG